MANYILLDFIDTFEMIVFPSSLVRKRINMSQFEYTFLTLQPTSDGIKITYQNMYNRKEEKTCTK